MARLSCKGPIGGNGPPDNREMNAINSLARSRGTPLLKSAEPKHLNGQFHVSRDHKVRHDLTDYRVELEAVAREAGLDCDIGKFRVAIEDEMPIRRERVGADLLSPDLTRHVRQVLV